MKLNSYRLNSMEEPSDELLHQLMEKVAIEARKSSHNAKMELKRRMKETAKKIASQEAH
jgi:predicted site-specific integrase-resolvase